MLFSNLQMTIALETHFFVVEHLKLRFHVYYII